MSKAQREAQHVLARFRIENPPVDVERIARELGVTVVYEPFDGNVSAMLYRDGRRTVIGVNANHSLRRQRFSIAHELGHLCLHQGRPIILDQLVRVNFRDERSSLATDQEEIAANAFAAELLMPEALVEREVRRHSDLITADDDQLIKKLADAFKVSTAAMSIRLVNLGLQSTPFE